MSVLENKWLTKPKKDSKSVQFVGVGKLASASVIDESILMTLEIL